MTLPNQHEKASIESSTSVQNYGHHLDAKQSYINTKNLNTGHHEALEENCGTFVYQKAIINISTQHHRHKKSNF